MPTTAEYLARLVQAKTDIGNAITAKGGTVNAGDGLEEFPADIATISTGNSGGLALLSTRCKTSSTILPYTDWEPCSFMISQQVASIIGSLVWTDGTNIYYSFGNTQYVINTQNYEVSNKTWNGLTNFYGKDVWSDGTNIYLSEGTTRQYVLDTSTSTWTAKTWNGLTNFYGEDIWTEGTNIYYSLSTLQYVLDTSTSTWFTKTWSGLNDFYGYSIWTDGVDIYISDSYNYLYYKYDTTTSSWVSSGFSVYVNGLDIWTDGNNIYYSDYDPDMMGTGASYILTKNTSNNIQWASIGWNHLDVSGKHIWTDGKDIYYTYGTDHYKYKKNTTTSITPTPNLGT